MEKNKKSEKYGNLAVILITIPIISLIILNIFAFNYSVSDLINGTEPVLCINGMIYWTLMISFIILLMEGMFHFNRYFEGIEKEHTKFWNIVGSKLVWLLLSAIISSMLFGIGTLIGLLRNSPKTAIITFSIIGGFVGLILINQWILKNNMR